MPIKRIASPAPCAGSWPGSFFRAADIAYIGRGQRAFFCLLAAAWPLCGVLGVSPWDFANKGIKPALCLLRGQNHVNGSSSAYSQ